MSLDGFVVFGPGSEWFWSMAQFIIVGASLLGVYLQLRQAGAQAAMKQLDEFESVWEAEPLLMSRRELLVHFRDATERDADLPESASTAVLNYWGKIATFAAVISTGACSGTPGAPPAGRGGHGSPRLWSGSGSLTAIRS